MKRRTLNKFPSTLHQVPNDATLREIALDTLQRSNLLGCFIGPKFQKGRMTRSLALVCLVREKLPEKAMRKKDLVPKFLKWKCGMRTVKEMSTDIVALSGDFTRASSVWGPGDAAETEAQTTVGFAMNHPVYGNVVTTAGHLVLNGAGMVSYPIASAPTVTLRNTGAAGTTQGRLVKAVCDDVRDYALVVPEGSAKCQNLFQDQYFIRHPYRPFAGELLRPVSVLSANGIRHASLRGVSAILQVDSTRRMHDLVLTDYFTYHGDSGACLIDDQSRTLGLLVGAFNIGDTTYSAFMPADVPLWTEGGRFL